MVMEPDLGKETANSLDLLRLAAASMVLYSHQHVLLGYPETNFLGLSSYGGAGVSVFFFLSGFLVWSSWTRDPQAIRFFKRRALRIFPALWVLTFFTVLVFGPAMSVLPLQGYLESAETWRYMSTAILLVRYSLPGVFENNPYPHAVNGSLWTLPLEFLCYLMVATVGVIFRRSAGWGLFIGMGLALGGAVFGVALLGERFLAHFEMVAFFWWGAVYAFVRNQKNPPTRPLVTASSVLLTLWVFWGAGPRGMERTALLFFAMGLVYLAQEWSGGARLTSRWGDLSYGMYIFAFPVQQALVLAGKSYSWSFEVYLAMSFGLTLVLSWLSWHFVEKRALRLKPRMAAVP